jgi:hypothetical protein
MITLWSTMLKLVLNIESVWKITVGMLKKNRKDLNKEEKKCLEDNKDMSLKMNINYRGLMMTHMLDINLLDLKDHIVVELGNIVLEKMIS